MGTVVAGDQKFYYIEKGSGTPILLIHGSGPDAEAWGAILDDLAQAHRVIAYSRRGFHGSSGSATSWNDHVEDAVAILQQLDAAPATVVGQSSGAIVAAHLAVGRSDLVRSLVLIEPALYMRQNLTPDLIWTVLKARLMGRLRGEDAAARIFLRYIMEYTTGGSAWDREDYPDERKQLLLRNAAAMLADQELGDGSQVSVAQLSELKVPVTIVMGELTRPRYIEKVGQSLAAGIPNAEIVRIPQAGHALAFDNPIDAARAIRQAASKARE